MNINQFFGENLFLIVICYFSYISAFNLLGLHIPLPSKITNNKYNPYCLMSECCNEEDIKFNRHRLIQNLTEHVYGQPLLEFAVDALSSHFNPYYSSSKPLTLSFHGMTGTGKNYVSNFIADSIFRKGSKSQYVHHFIGRLHFSEEKLKDEYKRNLYNWIKGNISECPLQLFIFDEVDKMIPDILNSIKPLIDYVDNVEGVDYSKAVFIFLSNTGASIINEHFHDLYVTEGIQREDLELSDFETGIQKEVFNEQGWLPGNFFHFLGGFSHLLQQFGGFFHSDTISNNLIDHYIPFLPLQQEHILKCIEKEFIIRKVYKPKKEHIDEVMKFIEWGPDSTKLFSKTGCKRLGPKVGLLVHKFYRHVSVPTNDEL